MKYRKLGTTIDLYYPARVDPNVPIEDTVGALKICSFCIRQILSNAEIILSSRSNKTRGK